MKIQCTKEPRIFGVKGHTIKDFGKILLDKDEMVSFQTSNNKEYDFVAKEWGFYATPSVNKRLKKEGFKTALVKNELNNLYIMVVDSSKLMLFKDYLQENQNNTLVCWLDEWFGDNV